MQTNKLSTLATASLTFVVTAAVVGGAMYAWQMPDREMREVETDEQMETTSVANTETKMDTKTAVKPTETAAQKPTTMGPPGSESQMCESAKLDLVMLKNTIVDYNCTQSGGTFKDLKCTCPKVSGDQLKYDTETGYCMDSFGAPGGELGQTERKMQELEMLKNQ